MTLFSSNVGVSVPAAPESQAHRRLQLRHRNDRQQDFPGKNLDFIKRHILKLYHT